MDPSESESGRSIISMATIRASDSCRVHLILPGNHHTKYNCYFFCIPFKLIKNKIIIPCWTNTIAPSSVESSNRQAVVPSDLALHKTSMIRGAPSSENGSIDATSAEVLPVSVLAEINSRFYKSMREILVMMIRCVHWTRVYIVKTNYSFKGFYIPNFSFN